MFENSAPSHPPPRDNAGDRVTDPMIGFGHMPAVAMQTVKLREANHGRFFAVCAPQDIFNSLSIRSR